MNREPPLTSCQVWRLSKESRISSGRGAKKESGMWAKPLPRPTGLGVSGGTGGGVDPASFAGNLVTAIVGV